MAEIKLLKIGADGFNTEHDSAADDVIFKSLQAGTGPKVNETDIDLNNTNLNDVKDLVFNDPSTSTLNQTGGALIIDNIVAKDRANLFSTGADISFPQVTDVVGQVDALRLPSIAGAPTAAPASGGEGHTLWDRTNKKLYVYDGSWRDQSVASSANNMDDSFTAGATALAAREVVQISGNDTVDKAQATTGALSDAIGFVISPVASGAPVQVRKSGKMSGFSGLTAGTRYYLDPAVAGGITATLPVGSGNFIVEVGKARNATTLDINIIPLSKRA